MRDQFAASSRQDSQNGCEAMPTTVGSKSSAITRSIHDSKPTCPPVVADHHSPEMPLALPGCEPTNGTAMLERHRPRRLRDRHAVLGAVVGHITDLEATFGQWASRSTRP
jgi:hypothetical protein